ncbi:unnamed protein product [Closterium sp. NIES-54]
MAELNVAALTQKQLVRLMRQLEESALEIATLTTERDSARGSKCEIFQDRLEFLGHVISKAGVEIDPKKLDTVKAWHPPTNITELQSFLGFANYVRRFVPDMARLTDPLTDLLGKGVTFTWGEKEHAAFSTLKNVFCSPPVLRIVDPHLPFEVVTDASDIAIGAVLLQEFADKLQPIAYESQKLHPPEKNYPIHDREMLAIVHTFKVWRCYLTGADVTVRIDHKSLQYLRAQPHLNPRQIRWLDYLESIFPYTVTYKKGASNIADALTRPTAQVFLLVPNPFDSDESVEPSGPYPELIGCLMYLMTYTRPDLAYPLSILARYVAPGRHRPEHMAAAKRVLRYLCSTPGLGLVLGGRRPVVLTGHADASWADDQATQRSSQGYTFSLGSGSVSWLSTRPSSVLGSSCEAEIYAGAMAAQELRWLTYLLTDLGEPPRSPPVLYVDNKAMLALCQEHRLEHRTKHIALRYFLARELQQRGQLRLAYVASEANTADDFTKALPPSDHQRFCTMLGLVPTWPHLLTS